MLTTRQIEILLEILHIYIPIAGGANDPQEMEELEQIRKQLEQELESGKSSN